MHDKTKGRIALRSRLIILDSSKTMCTTTSLPIRQIRLEMANWQTDPVLWTDCKSFSIMRTPPIVLLFR